MVVPFFLTNISGTDILNISIDDISGDNKLWYEE